MSEREKGGGGIVWQPGIGDGGGGKLPCPSRVEFLLQTDGGYPKHAGVTLMDTLSNPGNSSPLV